MKLLPMHQYTCVNSQALNTFDQKSNSTSEDEELLNKLSQDTESTFAFDHWTSETTTISCWPLPCASAVGHKKLNIDKLTTKPLVKTREGKRKIPDLPTPGWFDWILGSGEHSHGEEFVEEENKMSDRATMHSVTIELIIKFDVLICIFYDMRDIYVG